MYKNRHCPFVCLMILAGSLTGCASQTTFRPRELPAQYAARPTLDFSHVDLTRFASPPVNSQQIRSGDVLQVRLDSGAWEETAHDWEVGVDEDGQVALPNIGPVRLAGLSKSQAEQTIVQASVQRDVYLTPVVDVSLKNRVEPTVTVTGAVGSPGVVKIPATQASLADVIVRAGGLTKSATGRITVSATGIGAEAESGPSVALPENALTPVSHSEPGVSALTVSLQNTSESELAQILVPEGAIVSVETTPLRPIQVIGVIPNRGVQIPPGDNVRLLDALTMAGGPTYSNWILDKVYVIRRVPGSNQTVRIKGSIRKAKQDPAENLLLAPYDIVSVEENAVTFTLSTLSGLFGVGTNAARLAVGGGGF